MVVGQSVIIALGSRLGAPIRHDSSCPCGRRERPPRRRILAVHRGAPNFCLSISNFQLPLLLPVCMAGRHPKNLSEINPYNKINQTMLPLLLVRFVHFQYRFSYYFCCCRCTPQYGTGIVTDTPRWNIVPIHCRCSRGLNSMNMDMDATSSLLIMGCVTGFFRPGFNVGMMMMRSLTSQLQS
jgi:hypothetical protein